MGDRALVTFRSHGRYSPTVYTHWGGSETLGWVQEAAPAHFRRGDSAYSAARYAGFCHQKHDGKLSLGLFDSPKPDSAEWKGWNKFSHGDAGVVIVDVDSGEVFAVGGYAAGEDGYDTTEPVKVADLPDGWESGS